MLIPLLSRIKQVLVYHDLYVQWNIANDREMSRIGPDGSQYFRQKHTGHSSVAI